MLGLGGNNAPMNNGALNLGVQSQQGQMVMQSQNPWANQQMMGASQSPVMQGMFGGQQNQFTQQPVTPPSELEVQIMLLRGISPIERYVAGPQMGTLIEMLSTLVSFSVVEVLRNATFVVDEETGTMKMDVTTLPQNLQTLSAENVTGQFSTLQASAQQTVNQTEMEQQQLAAFAQQSMMGGALSAALANEGMMEKVGGGIGSLGRNFLGMR
jgi:flagellar capping protein FliD